MRNALIALGVALALAGAVYVLGIFESRPESAPRQIIVDPRYATTEQVMRTVRPLVVDAAEDGAVIEVWMADSGVAEAMTLIDLAGDFRPVGANPAAWGQEAEANAAAASRAIELAVETYSEAESGSDLFGGIRLTAARVQELPGSGTPRVTLVTFGGVHRTDALDLVEVEYGAVDPSAVIDQLATIDEPAVSVTVIGAGRFHSLNPPPDPVWAAGVRATWELFCTKHTFAECDVRDVATH